MEWDSSVRVTARVPSETAGGARRAERTLVGSVSWRAFSAVGGPAITGAEAGSETLLMLGNLPPLRTAS
jgi:hypothetical protein